MLITLLGNNDKNYIMLVSFREQASNKIRPSWEKIFDDAFTYSQILSIMKSKFYDSIYIFSSHAFIIVEVWRKNIAKYNGIKWFFIRVCLKHKKEAFYRFSRKKIFLEKFAWFRDWKLMNWKVLLYTKENTWNFITKICYLFA